MLAPITPFLSDYLWGVLRADDGPESVHLASWPSSDPALIDEQLAARMALARRLVELGRSARSAASVRTRQPLSVALIGATGFGELPAELRDLIADELNVHAVERLDPAGGDLVSYTVKPDFRALGRRFGADTQAVATAIRAAKPAKLAHAVAAEDGSATLKVPGLGRVTLTAADLVVTQAPVEGWGVATAGEDTVALDLAVTPELRAEGYAREVVRLIQDARKSAGLEVTDRIMVRWSAAEAELATALEANSAVVAGEVLAVSFAAGDGAPDDGTWHEYADDGLGLRFWLARVP
jgi:isoleucyl-tRNA synthetase